MKFTYKKVRLWLVPNLPDNRDFLNRPALKLLRLIPKQVNLRPYCSPVEDNGNLGSRTANAITGALEFLENKDKVLFTDMSRLFIITKNVSLNTTLILI